MTRLRHGPSGRREGVAKTFEVEVEIGLALDDRAEYFVASGDDCVLG